MNTKFNLKRIVSTVCLAATVIGAVSGAAAPQSAHAYTGQVTTAEPCQELEPVSANVSGSMLCVYEDSVMYYNIFTSVDAMYDFVKVSVPKLNLTKLDASEWHFAGSKIEGALVRGQSKGNAVLIWTHDDSAAYGVIMRNDADQKALYQWWGELMIQLYP